MTTAAQWAQKTPEERAQIAAYMREYRKNRPPKTEAQLEADRIRNRKYTQSAKGKQTAKQGYLRRRKMRNPFLKNGRQPREHWTPLTEHQKAVKRARYKRKREQILARQKIYSREWRAKRRTQLNARARERYHARGGCTASSKAKKKITNRAYYYRNKATISAKVVQYNKQRRQKHPEIYREQRRRGREKARKQLRPSYVKGLLVNGTALRRNDIPSDLVEVKRTQLQIKRRLRDEKHTRNAGKPL